MPEKVAAQGRGEKGGGVRRVRSLGALCKLAQERRSVVSFCYPLLRPRPAAFVIGWTGRVINQVINMGLFVYPKRKK